MRASCPQAHQDQGRPGTHAQCGDCPLPRAAVVPASQSTAEVATRAAHTPGLITDEARERAAQIIAVALREGEKVLARHLMMPSRSALDTELMWTVHSNARERDSRGMPGKLIWGASPRLLLTSRENGTAKSTNLTLVGRMAGSTHGRQSSMTAPGFAAMIDRFNEPVILDDVANIFGRGEGHRMLQTHILNGYTPDVITFDARKGGTSRNLFGVVALAGKDDLITASMSSSLEDLLSRCIIIRMKRATRFYPDIDDDARQAATMVHHMMLQWAYVMGPELRQAYWELGQEAVAAGEQSQADVDSGLLRKVQLHRPLLACARVIGGDWPDRMLEAASTANGLEDITEDIKAVSARMGEVAPMFTDEGQSK